MVFVVIDVDPKIGAETADVLRKFGYVHEAYSSEELKRVLSQERQIDAFFVGVNVGPAVVQSLRQQFRSPIFLLGDISLSALHQAYEIGVTDVLPVPLNPKWVEQRLSHLQNGVDYAFSPQRNAYPPHQQPAAVDSVFQQNHPLHGQPIPSAPANPDWSVPEIPRSPVRSLNRVIVVGSVKGGEGKTSLAGQLGIILSKKGYLTLGIDADQTGNLARWIGRDVTGDITEFGSDRPPSDSGMLESLLVKHRSEFRVLPSPVRSLIPITPEIVERAIQAYRPHYPVIIVDLSEGYTPVLKRLAEKYATDILILASTDVSRVERTKQMVQLMLAQGISRQKIHVIVNKVRQEKDYLPIRAGISELGVDVRFLPWHSELGAAREEGMCPVLTDPKSEYAKAFRRMVSEIMRIQVGSGRLEETTGEKKKAKKKRRRTKAVFSVGALFRRFAASSEE